MCQNASCPFSGSVALFVVKSKCLAEERPILSHGDLSGNLSL